MLQAPLWSRILTCLVLVIGILIALPNVPQIRPFIPSWLPYHTLSLGLDLQGGAYLALEVNLTQVQQEKLETLRADVRTAFNKKPRIGYNDLNVKGEDGLTVTVTDQARLADARKILNDLNPLTSTSILGAGGARSYTMTEPGNGTFVLQMTDAYKKQTQQQILEQSVTVVGNRIDEMGTRETSVQRQGEDRILVQVPGLKDPTHLQEQLQKTAKMTFKLVDERADAAYHQGNTVVPFDDEVLPEAPRPGETTVNKIVVQKRVAVDGNRLVDASQGFNPQNGTPIVNFRFDSLGAKQFGDITKAYQPHTQRFAVVLDNQIITAPVMNDPILGGQGYIEGNFTTAQANDLAVLLRAGALPASLTPIETRTVSAELGDDSIQAGRYSAIAGLVLVALFMIARYGLFGVFADIALTLNIVLLLAVLTTLGATLTLPGIAGIVLTMGMAVDANVLIYERIREEVRNGRSMLAAIDSGFKRAMATIIDANMTHLIAASILYMVGTGSVRGFAVTLGFGIITSFFTAVMVTRLIVITWLNVRRPRRLYI